jgi:molybdopterin-guanine dinucleotide biosynthesis protein A
MEIDNCGYGSKPMAASDGKSAARRRGIQPPSRDALASHITGAILAGGASRRLGRDKALTPLAGKALALRVADALAPLVSSCWLITNQPLAHAALGLPLVTDLWPFQGPVGGLITALFQARTPWILAAAVDNPFPAPELLAKLAFLSAETSRPAVVCRSPRGLEPFPGLYAVRLLPRLTDFLRQDRRPTRFLEVCRPLVLSEEEVGRLDPEGSSFFNLNTAAEVARATAWWMARCARESDQP